MVELQQFQSEWAMAFTQEANRVMTALPDSLDAIEHIGSTAVPTMIAKPIIDLAARSLPSVDPFALADPLMGIGYRQHTSGPKTHAIYVRSQRRLRTHILHVFSAEQWTHCNQRLFRDKLLHDPQARHSYRALKESIAQLDGRAYTAAKLSLIQDLLNEERSARGLPPATAWDK